MSNLKSLSSAVVSSVIVAILTYVGTFTPITILQLDLKQIFAIAVLTGAASLLKKLGTDNEGVFAGVVKIK